MPLYSRTMDGMILGYILLWEIPFLDPRRSNGRTFRSEGRTRRSAPTGNAKPIGCVGADLCVCPDDVLIYS